MPALGDHRGPRQHHASPAGQRGQRRNIGDIELDCIHGFAGESGRRIHAGPTSRGVKGRPVPPAGGVHPAPTDPGDTKPLRSRISSCTDTTGCSSPHSAWLTRGGSVRGWGEAGALDLGDEQPDAKPPRATTTRSRSAVRWARRVIGGNEPYSMAVTTRPAIQPPQGPGRMPPDRLA